MPKPKPSLLNLETFMKSRMTIALILFAALNATFATICTPLDFSKDNLDARLAVQERALMKSMRVEYDAILSARICLLKYDGVRRCFGRKLFWTPSDCTLPLFAENGSARGGYTLSPDKSHTDFNAIGDLGYVEIFYNSDGESIGDAAIYFRTDEQFVPLQSTNDYYKRVSWEMAKFNAMKEWLDQHLPKVKDLGTVEVTNSPSGSISRIGNRIELGEGKSCLIDFRANPLITAQQAATNEFFYVDLYLSPTDSKKQFLEIAKVRSHKSVVFAVNGQFYQMTLKQKVSPPESAPAR